MFQSLPGFEPGNLPGFEPGKGLQSHPTLEILTLAVRETSVSRQHGRQLKSLLISLRPSQ